eukprot:364546-Chlamydomonas_euryale.AAC.11
MSANLVVVQFSSYKPSAKACSRGTGMLFWCMMWITDRVRTREIDKPRPKSPRIGVPDETQRALAATTQVDTARRRV